MVQRDATTIPCDCATHPVEDIRRLFVDVDMTERIRAGQRPARRGAFAKPHGCAHGTFVVAATLPHDLKVGVFGHARFPAWVRFSSDTQPPGPDLKKPLGLAIKLFGVPGEKILETDRAATTHDFIFQNHDVFFVDTATDMCAFTCAGFGPSYYEAHPATKQIVDAMYSKEVGSVALTDYWSVLPYAFGPGRYAKYKLQPLGGATDPAVTAAQRVNPNYLHDDLRGRLLKGPVAFAFHVQLRTHPAAMPLDQATVRWDEAASPPIHVATLTLPVQDIDAPGQAAYGDNLSFTPWHALPEHAPVGSIGQARKTVYEASVHLRRTTNGVASGEPSVPWTPPPTHGVS